MDIARLALGMGGGPGFCYYMTDSVFAHVTKLILSKLPLHLD